MPETKTNVLDIDAIIGELEGHEPLIYRGQSFDLPAEFPAAVLGPFLRPELGLIDAITQVLTDAADDASWVSIVIDVLGKAPSLPAGLLEAAQVAFKALLGDDQYTRFVALNPSVQAYLAIARGVITTYGVSLFDFFGSDESSETVGELSSPTSPASTTETPETSGDAETTHDFSD